MDERLVPRDRAMAELRTLAARDHWVALYTLLHACQLLDWEQLNSTLDVAFSARLMTDSQTGDQLGQLLRERFGQ